MRVELLALVALVAGCVAGWTVARLGLLATATATVTRTQGQQSAWKPLDRRKCSRATKLTPRETTHVWERVCWTPSDESESYMGGGTLHVFQDERRGEPFIIDAAWTEAVKWQMTMWMAVQRHNASEWTSWSRNGTNLLRKKTLLFPLNPNPFHCLMDEALSLFADPSGKRESFEAVVGTKTVAQLSRDRDVGAEAEAEAEACDPGTEWCCMVLHRLALFPPFERPPFTYSESASEPVCFRELHTPAFTRARWALDWSLPWLRAQREKPIFFPVNMDPAGFPQRGVDDVRERLLGWDSLLSLPRRARSPKAREGHAVVVVDRIAAPKRTWINGVDIVPLLLSAEERRIEEMHYFGEGWDDLRPLEQAAAFHRATVVLTAEGAQNANAIFMPRRDEKQVVVEVGCGYDDATHFVRYVSGELLDSRATWLLPLAKRMGLAYWLFASPPARRKSVPTTDRCRRETAGFSVRLKRLLTFVRQYLRTGGFDDVEGRGDIRDSDEAPREPYDGVAATPDVSW